VSDTRDPSIPDTADFPPSPTPCEYPRRVKVISTFQISERFSVVSSFRSDRDYRIYSSRQTGARTRISISFTGDYRLNFVLPQCALVLGQKGEGLDEIDKCESEKGKFGCLGCDRVICVEGREWFAEASEGGGGRELGYFVGDLVGEKVFLEVMLCRGD
jgi:hypothetical protein